MSGCPERGFDVWRSRVAPSSAGEKRRVRVHPASASGPNWLHLSGGAQARPEQQDCIGVLGRWGAFPAPPLALGPVALPDDAEARRHHFPA